MNDLPPPDVHYFRAALGWLELGNPAEAKVELDGISHERREHPDVLDARWWLASQLQQWDDALAIARRSLEIDPERISGWIHQAYALRRVKTGGLEQARAALFPAVKKFPKEEIILFNLACYAAQMGQLNEAWDWLHQCMETAGNIEQVKQRALADEDLKPLWPRIQEL